jgi:oligosaccharide translocation protein RFT1
MPEKSAPSTDTPSEPSPLATGRALILLQLLSRALTFILNQGLVRHAPPAVFGTAAIQFDLVAATILFLSREGVRNAVLRSSSSASSISTWPLKLGLGVTLASVTFYLSMAPDSTTAQPHFHLSLALYVLGALLELLVEPFYIRATRNDLKVRVAAEGGQAAVRTALSFAFLVALPYIGDREGRGPLLGMAMGYCAGSAWLAARYLWAYGGIAALPGLLFSSASSSRTPGEEDQESSTRSLAIVQTRQSVIKHVLTEADRFAVSAISPLGEQGGYAIAVNYGGCISPRSTRLRSQKVP